MEVLLKENVYKLGAMGNIVKVKSGYARNFLIPTGKAIHVSEKNKNEIQKQKKLLTAKLEEELKEKQALASKLEGLSVEVKVKVNEEGGLYGSVSEAELSKALKEKGFDIDKRAIRLGEPLREQGEFEFSIYLAPKVMAKLKVNIISDEQ